MDVLRGQPVLHQGALAAYDPNRQMFGLLEMFASLAVFTSSLLYVRWRFQLNRRLAGEGANPA